MLISSSIYVDDKWHGEIRTNKMSDQQGYQFYLTDLLSEQGYDISVKVGSIYILKSVLFHYNIINAALSLNHRGSHSDKVIWEY